MLDEIRHFADLSIRRACGFGMIAIGTAVMGASFDALLALKTAAICVSAMGAILLVKAMEAPTRNYKRTEVWILLDRRHDLPEARAQQVFGSILRDRYIWHATVTAGAAAFLWLATLVVALFGRRHGVA